jgi:UTP--glucose-1-phosphate uridylyltransferase
MVALMQRKPLFGVRYAGRRHDIGNKLDFVKANLWWGLRRPDMAESLRDFLRSLD